MPPLASAAISLKANSLTAIEADAKAALMNVNSGP